MLKPSVVGLFSGSGRVFARRVSLSTLLALGAVACGGDGKPVNPPAGMGGGGGGGAGGTGPVADASIWSDSSRSIDVTCGSYWMGSMRFVATRDQLTADQLAVLSNLKVVDALPQCIEDGFSCSITVGSADGSSVTMAAVEGDTSCRPPERLVSYATFKPFLDTLTCQYGRESVQPSPADDVIAPDARCFNGLFTTGSGDITRQIPVIDPGEPLRIDLDDCDQPGRAGKFSFTLLDADGTTLGTSTAPLDPGSEHTCASLTVMVPGPTIATLLISVNGAMPAGDLWLRVYQVGGPVTGAGGAAGAGGVGATGGVGGRGGAGGAAGPIDAPVWTDSSQSVDVSCSGVFSGQMRFAATRAQMTAEQLAQLSNLRTVGRSASCSTDGMSCQVTITAADGSTRTVDAEQDGWCLDTPRDLVSFLTLKPFLDGLDCVFIRTGLFADDLVPLDQRCFDGVASAPRPTSFQLAIDDVTRPLHLELDGCDQPGLAGKVSFSLFDTDGTTSLGTSAPPADAGPYHACAAMTVTAPHPGHLTVTVSANVTPAVGFWLRAYQ